MEDELGHALAQFDRGLQRLREAVASDPELAEAAFQGADEWANLLTYKLVPHLADGGCLIAAVAGGTNTGKSTVFNVLLGKAVSPVMATAAATRRPVIAASAVRAKQCLEGKLVPEFAPQPLEQPENVTKQGVAPDALFVATADTLSDQLVLLDTPDIDSIEKDHWVVAEHIQAAGDVLIAVLTGEKYRDERVVAFFRRALESGRVVIPVMNKADPEDGFLVARRQLEEFCSDLELDGTLFVLEHDPALSKKPVRPLRSIDGTTDLRTYLAGLDTAVIKRRVYRDSVRHFAERAGAFLEHVESVGAGMQSAAAELEARATRYAAQYDPAPGSEVGGLFHEFVQSRRGAVRRSIGTASKAVVRGVTAAGRAFSRAFRKRASLEPDLRPRSDAEIHALHAQALDRITRDLATDYIETARNLREPAAHLVESGLREWDVDAAVDAVVAETLRADSPSAEFRRHALRMLESWWDDHRGRRRIVEALDAILAVTPAAIAVPVALYTGPGIPEATVAIAGPVVEQFAARVFEYQFGDAMFDFLSPWRAEQQAALEQALRRHLTDPALAPLRRYLEPLTGESISEMKEWLGHCGQAQDAALDGGDSEATP